jgi:hypothetical protein
VFYFFLFFPSVTELPPSSLCSEAFFSPLFLANSIGIAESSYDELDFRAIPV